MLGEENEDFREDFKGFPFANKTGVEFVREYAGRGRGGAWNPGLEGV